MLINIKALFKDKFGIGIVWNMASLILLALGGVIINIEILKLRGPGALGLFNQVYAIYIVLSQIGVGGIQFSVLQQISYHQGEFEKCANITSSALLLVTLITMVIGSVGWFVAPSIGVLLGSPDTGLGLQMVIPGLLFFALNKVLINVLNGFMYMRTYAVFRSFRFILIPIFTYLIIAARLPDAYLILSLTITEVLLFIGLTVFIQLNMFSIWGTKERWLWMKQHFSFGLRGVLSGILNDFITRADVLMFGYFSSDVNVGIYSFVSTLAEGFAQIPYAIRWNVDPLIGDHFSRRENDKIELLAKKIKLQFYPVMAAVSVAAIIGYPIFYKVLIADNAILTSALTFAIIMVGVGINGGYRPFTGILLQGKKPGTYTLFYLCLVLGNITLNLILIPILGIYGVALVTSLTYILEAVILVLLSKIIFKIRL